MLKLLAVLAIVGLAPGTLAAAQPADAVSRPAAGRDQVIFGVSISQESTRLNPIFTELSVGRTILATVFTVDVEKDSAWKPFPQGVEYLPSLKDGSWRVDGDRMTLSSLPLYIRSQPAAAKVGLRNFAPIQAGGASETWNAHQWFWK